MSNISRLEFFKELQKDNKYKNIPFMMIISEFEREKVLETVQAGINHYMVKTVKAGPLEAKIKQIFEAH